MRRYSHSSIKRFQRCQYSWKKYYIDRIEPTEKKAHFARGVDLHEGLELYHTFDPKFAEWMLDADPADRDILVRYADKWDEEWTVIDTEAELEMTIGPYTLVFIPDLIVEIAGEVWIVDHKTTANIPDEWDPYNMTDFQHLLYVEGLRQNGYDVKGFIFNYLRTKPPTQPALVKDGSKISNLRALDTDFDTLRNFAETTGFLDDEDVKDKLYILKNAPDRYFQRHFLMAPDAAVEQAVKDVYTVLQEMSDKEHGRGSRNYPRHVMAGYAGSAACKSCEYQPLCHQELMGEVVHLDLLGYQIREERT